MTNRIKAIAMIVAGAVLIALPEPFTTALGVALITKGLKMLKKSEEAAAEATVQMQESAEQTVEPVEETTISVDST